MSEMVERVAIAIGKVARGRDSSEISPDSAVAAARAAIEAVRQPTPEMLIAGRSAGDWRCDSEGDVLEGNASDVFTAMIDAALNR